MSRLDIYRRRRLQRQQRGDDLAFKCFKVTMAIGLALILLYFLFTFGCAAVVTGLVRGAQTVKEAAGR